MVNCYSTFAYAIISSQQPTKFVHSVYPLELDCLVGTLNLIYSSLALIYMYILYIIINFLYIK